jgi:hypothetical protein
VKNHRPSIVVLENVVGAPWKFMCMDFDELGYQGIFFPPDLHIYIFS